MSDVADPTFPPPAPDPAPAPDSLDLGGPDLAASTPEDTARIDINALGARE